MSEKKPVVLLIGGAGRSGSTLLERLLGQVPGFVAVGELFHVWSRSFLDDQICGCGRPFSQCPFWQAVVTEAQGTCRSLDPAEIARLMECTVRTRHLPRMAILARGDSARAARLQEVLVALYRAIVKVADARIIVDSSKAAAYAFFLRSFVDSPQGIDLRIVHLVRDSRGVAHSWMRKIVRPEIVGREELMPRLNPCKAAAWWVKANALCPLLGATNRYMRIRYEDLVARPESTLRSIIEFAGEAPGSLPFFQAPSTVELAVNHTVAGNPFRFKTGATPLFVDEAWREEMSWRAKTVVTLLTLPWLAQYGYLFERGSSDHVC